MALGSFTLDINNFVAKAKGNADIVVRKIALDLFTRVIEMSPVDTGRFKNNWLVAIGTVPSGTIAFDETGKHSDKKTGGWDKSGNATISEMTATVLESKAGDVIFLVNNLPYSRRLEYGYSRQAPAGMVRIAVQEYGAIVKGAVAAAGQQP